MSAIVVRITPSGFTSVVVDADSRAEYRRLTVAQHLLWPDLDRLKEKAERVMTLCGDAECSAAVPQ
jgi:hypothetical protein